MKSDNGKGALSLIKLLGVETSSPTFSVAVCEGEKILTFLEAQVPKGQPSTSLTELIDNAIRQAGCDLESLDGFSISIGPGSFTGLRVGVMTVKTLSWALKKQILPISSLEVLAQNLKGSAEPVVPFVDARKGKIYVRVTEDRLLLPEEALKNIPQGACLVGDGVKRYQELVGKRPDLAVASAEMGIPRADHLCRLAASRWPQGCLADPHRLVPEYLYSKESDITGW